MSDDTQAFDQWWVHHVLPDGQRPYEWAGSVGIGVIAERAFNAGRRALEIIDTKSMQSARAEVLEKMLAEARAQGAAGERERLARLADENANSEDCLKPDVAAWNDIAVWLRSNTGEGA